MPERALVASFVAPQRIVHDDVGLVVANDEDEVRPFETTLGGNARL